MSNAPDLLDSEFSLGTSVGEDYLKHEQVITQDFIDSLKCERAAKSAVRMGNFNRVASVPTSVMEIWMKQGRDPYRASARDVVKWLNKDSLDAFITTPGRV